MRSFVSATFVHAFILSLCLTFFCPSISSAIEQKSYHIPFLGNGTTIEFCAAPSQDGDGVRAYLTGTTETGRIPVDLYEAEGGVSPEIKSAFVSGRRPKKLFIIVTWAADSPSIGTGGSIYQVFVYDEQIEKAGGSLTKLKEDSVLTKRFGVGFDGTREGKRVTYKYRNASAVRRQLVEWGYK
ncbi:hypothetical protein HDG40_000434 [Paraburkholderia sp. JPY158]|uniref:Uncharacterized protein n=1 Tax=Paraburkholderia atlantica TaxID=2654982 RepID=A0A7W8Q203_PARAM|nr:hypothetical protein [Paraburkholderia atlantica]MBB5422293.1 hypothetical protein [Paraburkholderia atlantica]